MTVFGYGGAGLAPTGSLYGNETFENEFYFGRYESQIWDVGAVIDNSAVDSGNTDNTTTLRAGLILGKKTSDKKYYQWDPTATDGTQFIAGILRKTINMVRTGSTTADRFVGEVMIGGWVDSAKLIIPGNAALGISGDANEFAVVTGLYPRFIIAGRSDQTGAMWRGQVAKTADYTLTTADHNILFTNTGASGAVNFTTMATALRNFRFGIYVAADQNVTLTAGTADTLIVHNDIAADTIAFSTSGEKVGNMLEVIGTGSKWLVRPSLAFESVTVSFTS